jgi:tRNA A-37 threonylcarbamoyl transferase component Bud32
VSAGYPRLRLRGGAAELLDLPWASPLADWPVDAEGIGGMRFRDLPIGPSRHLVRFLVASGRTYALKEEPIEVARTEFEVLRHLRVLGLPAVRPIGLIESVDCQAAVIVTEYLEYSIQYRRLMMRFPLGPGPYRDRLLDAMAWLLVDLHRAGVFWGDCSLANTLFRRDGDKIQAYLVDAETSEIHPSLSDGQRSYDLEILVENVAFGLADLGAMQDRKDAADDAVEAAESVRARYAAVWDELLLEPELSPDDRHAVRARIRRLNELGFAVDEITLEPSGSNHDVVRLKVAVANRRFHARELERLTGINALEGQARLLLNDLHEYRAWLEFDRRTPVDEVEGADRWVNDVLEPSLRELMPAIGPGRDPLQAYCDVLEEKWILSEAVGTDVGLAAAMDAYLGLGAPAPEGDGPTEASSPALDIDWNGGWEVAEDEPRG